MNWLRKTFKYKLYPTEAQTHLLNEQLSQACCLYNAALQERRDAYRISHQSINYYDQANQLKEIRADGNLTLANFSCCQDVLRRVDKTFKAFFRRVRDGQTAGYPRFRSINRYDSLTFPSWGDGCGLLPTGTLRIQGVGKIKIKKHREIEGNIKTCTIKREAGNWYACFSVEYEAKPLPLCRKQVGIDVGLTAFATLNDGTEIDNPRYYKKAQSRLRKAQRKVSRRQKGSHRRRKAIQELQRAHAYIRNQRNDFHHKTSEWLVASYGLVVAEDLNIKGLASGMLSKSVKDAGWGSFLDKIAYKAAEAGRRFIRVNPNGTSQTCLCGAKTPKTLSQRWHECGVCGLSAPRDHVSAQLILRLGLSLQDGTYSVG